MLCSRRRGCGVSSLEFSHLIASQAPLRGYHGRGGVSPTIDLPDGYETYKKQHREGGSGEIRKIEALERKMEREVGPLRFEAHAKDGAMLDWVAQRKGRRLLLSFAASRRSCRIA